MDGNTIFITKAADIAASKGILVVNSAGNLADDPWKYISAPADGDSVIAVGAVDKYATYVYFSSLGPTSDGRIKPNVVAMGYQTTIEGIDGNITFSNGTSFSAPIIAGLAACLWQRFPELNNMEIIHKIEESASQYSFPNYQIGYGIPDFCKAANFSYTNLTTITNSIIINVFPNPFIEYINITIDQNIEKPAQISLYNAVGQLLREQIADPVINKTTSFSGLDNLSPGIYWLKIQVDNQLITKKIIKL